VVTDWNKDLLIDIKVIDYAETCGNTFSTDPENTEELFANIWQGERLIYTDSSESNVEYSRCVNKGAKNC
jgi:hypothetical protein